MARGKNRFLSGSAEVALDCPGRDPTAEPHEKWPAVFFTQTELQRQALDAEAVEEILARLVASETRDIAVREKRLKEFDKELASAARMLAKLDDDVADAEQGIPEKPKSS